MKTRRAFLIGGGLTIAAPAAWYAGGQNLFYSAITEAIAGEAIDAPTAHEYAMANKITLIDIRRPDEWAKTGSGEGANRLDMRRDDFIAELDKITGGDRSSPVALICARGVRSARMTNRLNDAGFTNIIDVPEGMLGSASGPGWVKRGLPLNKS
ncbi:MAG: rhodanese-like domain-containing protein [Litoreibacter sp.]